MEPWIGAELASVSIADDVATTLVVGPRRGEAIALGAQGRRDPHKGLEFLGLGIVAWREIAPIRSRQKALDRGIQPLWGDGELLDIVIPDGVRDGEKAVRFVSEVSGVDFMRITLNGSGAIDDIGYTTAIHLTA